jgi:hypothetical protein
LQLALGLVLPLLTSYKRLVHEVASSPLVAMTDFTYGAPLYKGNPKIVADLATAESALDKFDAYFDHGILDEEERVRLAHVFTKQYAKRNPASERQDLFLASGDVLKFMFEVKPILTMPESKTVLETIEGKPHDGKVLSSLRAGTSIDREALRGTCKLYLDHVYNPRRYEDDEVKRVRPLVKAERPVVVELLTNGAIPGVFFHVLGPIVQEVGGQIVVLPG